MQALGLLGLWCRRACLIELGKALHYLLKECLNFLCSDGGRRFFDAHFVILL